jgi:HEAT repeat protein
MTQVNFVNGALLVIIGAAAVAAQPVPPVPPEAPVLAAPPAPNVRPFPAPMPDVAAIVADAKSRAFAFSFAQSRDMRDRDGRDADRNYRDGSRSLDRGEWDKAAEQFSAVIDKKGERMDGAYYWKAYALGKMGKRDEAVNLINELEKTNPKSRWLDDAKALRVELRQASGQPVSADIQNDEELKLIALNGLVDTAPERAIPAVGDLLKKSSSPRLKERALFVLAQSRSPQARDILVQYAKGAGNPDLQLKAVDYLGMHKSKENTPLLADIYTSSSDPAIRRRILRAYMMTREKDRLLEAARSEQDMDLRREAIMYLGAIRAEAELQQMYSSETKPELRRQIIHAMMASQSAKGLVEIARKETNPELKREAVQMLSSMKTKEATDYLMELVSK